MDHSRRGGVDEAPPGMEPVDCARGRPNRRRGRTDGGTAPPRGAGTAASGTGDRERDAPSPADVAGIRTRIAARLVDAVVEGGLVAIGAAVAALAGVVLPSGPAALVTLVAVVGGILGSMWALIFLEGQWDGQSVGKRALGLRVVNEDGSPIGHDEASLRNLLEFLDAAPLYLLGLALAYASPLNQRVGDRVAGTVVVDERD